MKNKLRRSFSAVTALVSAVSVMPISAMNAWAAGGTAVIPLNYTAALGDNAALYYRYDETNSYQDDDKLGYYIEPVLLIPGGIGGNETGGLPIDAGIVQEDSGAIYAEKAGTYELRAKLLDGWTWSDNTTAAKTVKYTVGKGKVAVPTPKQEEFAFHAGESHNFEFTEDITKYCVIDEEKSTLSATDAGTYQVYVNLKDTESYSWEDDTTEEKVFTFSINECTECEFDEYGFCKNCGKATELVYNKAQEQYEISNYAQLKQYLEMGDCESAILMNDIVVNDIQVDIHAGTYTGQIERTLTPANLLKSGCIFDGNGYVIRGFSPSEEAGLFIYNKGTIQNLGFVDCYIPNGLKGGLFCCYNSYGTIQKCFFVGACQSVQNHDFSIFSISSTSGEIKNNYAYGILPYNVFCQKGNVPNSNAYCHTPGTGRSGGNAGYLIKAYEDYIASGQFLYDTLKDKTGAIWHQNLDNGKVDPYPYPCTDNSRHAAVYSTQTKCGGQVFSNSQSKIDHRYQEGICISCSEYQEPEQINGVYQIANAGNLFWFAQSAEEDAKAVLTADIEIPEANSEDVNWLPKESFTGSFDGQGHIITNLHTSESGAVGLFGELGEDAVVKNVEVHFALDDGSEPTAAGAICAVNNGTISGCLAGADCAFEASENCGGICGENNGTVENCLSLVSGMNVCGSGTAAVDSYYAASADSADGGCSDETLLSGSVANALGIGQELDGSSYPSFSAPAVYQLTCKWNDGTETVVYSNGAVADAVAKAVAEKTGTSDSYETTLKGSDGTPFTDSEISDDMTLTVSYTLQPIVLKDGMQTSFELKVSENLPEIDLSTYCDQTKVAVVDYSCDNLPQGIHLANGIIYGNPEEAGTYTLEIKLTAENGETETLKLKIIADKNVAPAVKLPISYMTLTYGDTLANAPLSEPEWKWMDKNAVPTVNNSGMTAYLEVDAENYDYSEVKGFDAANSRIVRSIAVKVQPKKLTESDITLPTAKSVAYGKTLADATLSDSAWTWDSPNTIPAVSNSGYAAKMTVTDSINYDYSGIAGYNDVLETVTKTIAVTVTKSKATAPADPSIYNAAYGSKLEKFALGGGWQWVNPNAVPTTTEKTFDAVLKVTDDGNYDYSEVAGYDEATHTITRSLTVNVRKAKPESLQPPTVSASVEYGKTRADAEVSDGWLFTDPDKTFDALGSAAYEVYYPVDDENYDYSEVDGYDADRHAIVKNVTVTVEQGTPETVDVPTVDANLKYGETLADAELPDGWQWTDDTQKAAFGTNSYEAYYPVDDTNYDYSDVDGYDADRHAIVKNVTVTVEQGTPETVEAPTVDANLTYGETLADAELPDGWQWTDDTQKAAFGTNSYEAYYPVDDVHFDYSDVEGYDADRHAIVMNVEVTAAVSNAVLDAVSVTLDGKIGLNYFLALPESLADTIKAEVEYKGETYPLEAMKTADGRYKLTFYVVAKEMHDDITLRLFDGENPISIFAKDGTDKGTEFVYSVAKYLNSNEVRSSTDSKLTALAEKMLGYGTYSQILKNYSTDTAVDTISLDSVTAESTVAYAAKAEGSLPDGLTFVGLTLMLETDTSVRFYFKADSMDAYSFAVDGKPVSAEASKAGEYYVECSGIAAKDLDEAHTLTINDTCTITFSALSYAAAAISSDDANQQNEAKALYLYWQAADAYFAQSSGQ